MVDQESMDHNPYSRGELIVCAVVLLVVVGFAVLTYFTFNPLDRVNVKVLGVPTGTYFVCLVAENDGNVRAMDCSVKVIAPHRMRAAKCIWSYVNPEHPCAKSVVMWEWGDRYGVVQRTVDDRWHVTWFDSNDLAMHGRYDLLDQASGEIDLSKGKSTPLTAELVRQAGLDGVHSFDAGGSEEPVK